MPGNFLLLTLFSFCFAASAGAAELVAAQGLTVEEAVALSGVKLEDEKPTAMTAEEKLKVQQPLRNDINYLSENYRPNELDMVVDAVKTLEKNKLRRLNRDRRPTERIKVKDVKVNTKRAENVSKYFNAKITNTLLQSMPEDEAAAVVPEQEK